MPAGASGDPQAARAAIAARIELRPQAPDSLPARIGSRWKMTGREGSVHAKTGLEGVGAGFHVRLPMQPKA